MNPVCLGGGAEGVPPRDLRPHLEVSGPSQKRTQTGNLDFPNFSLCLIKGRQNLRLI